jgi:hypothetical protein
MVRDLRCLIGMHRWVVESRTYGGGLPKVCARCGRKQPRETFPRGMGPEGPGEKSDL